MMSSGAITLRSDLRPGDIGAVAAMHGLLYAREYGFDVSFEAYVAEPLSAFALRTAPRERIWLAEDGGKLVGCVAIVEESAGTAQLRWFLVIPAARKRGLGRRLLQTAVEVARRMNYRRIGLWTVSALTGAAKLYRAAGFHRVEVIPGERWGASVTEEKYELML
jgi:GNAT superfamily N-acetyltransferase